MQNIGEGLPKDRLRVSVLRTWTLMLVLMLSGPVLAAGFTCTQRTESNAAVSEPHLDELEEVVVNGEKASGKKDLSVWLKRLAGQYRYEGHVDLCGNGNVADQLPVTGKSDCAALDPSHEPTRNVYCLVDVRWREVLETDGSSVKRESSFSPAMIVYGLAPGPPGIQSIQIDSKGIATHARGELAGDTLTLRASCIGVPGNCRRITRITARPDSDEVVMLIDMEIDSRRTLREAFLMRRVTSTVRGLPWLVVP